MNCDRLLFALVWSCLEHPHPTPRDLLFTNLAEPTPESQVLKSVNWPWYPGLGKLTAEERLNICTSGWQGRRRSGFPLCPPSAKAQIAEPGKSEVCVNTLFPQSPKFGVSLTKVWLRILKGWSCVAVESISALVSGEKWSIDLLWDISVASPLRFCRCCFANADQGAWLTHLLVPALTVFPLTSGP